jgi:hypothetical protein
MTNDLTTQYVKKIKPILSLAKKAYGSRTQNTPAHKASREYTDLLIEYYEKGGSLPQLAEELDVAYAGIRRRIVMKDVTVESVRPKKSIKHSTKDIVASAKRVEKARDYSVETYHDQLAEEYKNGVPLSLLAKEIGLSSAAPLYYGIQRSLQRRKK